MFKKLFVVIFSIIILAPLTVRAENRSYYYDRIDATIIVNSDSTLTVEERQTYNYTGKYTVGWRSIDLNKLGSVTDVEVYDGETGQKLNRASIRPVTDTSLPTPSDYGKYATFKKNGRQNIEWYYNMENTNHTWILKYKVHGVIEFGKNNDRLYYNIFTDYTVPVKNSQVIVVMPTDTGLTANAYRNMTKKIERTKNGNEISFNATDFVPAEAFTIDILFPKNIVTKAAFWKDWLKSNYGYVGSAIVILLSILIALIRWIVTEVLPKGRGTIVPQYSPPQNLPPAMAELIVKEKITPKTWTATLIDLAVRGYINIEEEKKKSFNTNVIIIFFALLILSMLFSVVTPRDIPISSWQYYIPCLAVGIIVLVVIIKIFKSTQGLTFAIKEYKIKKIKPAVEEKLRDYERTYLNALFSDSDKFSTSELKQDSYAKQEMYKKMKETKKELLKETEKKNDAFDVGLSKEKYFGFFFVALFLAVWLFFFFVPGGTLPNFLNAQTIILSGVSLLCFVGLFLFFKFEARLSQKGREMKEEWLGFKMYLEVAEKYRMQNLTPDLFEKYLPYAMIFNVEKKWAKNFEAMHLPAPEWYHSAMIAGASTGPLSVSSFSPSAFSSSFLSSFSSSFSSSSGGGGGGSAGGGGGGGGGGAR